MKALRFLLSAIARNLSAELIGRGILVNAVSPGPIETPLYKRFGKAAEIASAVVFLASDESAFTVGSELIIDGGLGL